MLIKSKTTIQFALIHEPDIPGSNAILLFTASDLASITSHIQNWVLFLLWLHVFIVSRAMSLLISSSILGTYQPGKMVKHLSTMWETRVQSLGWEDPLEEGMTTHSSILAWKIPLDKGAWWASP